MHRLYWSLPAYLNLVRGVRHKDRRTMKGKPKFTTSNSDWVPYVGSLALILPPAPCSAVRNLECIKAGFGEGNRMRFELSRKSRKYGSWSIAMGIKQWIFATDLDRCAMGSGFGSSDQISGYDVAKAAAHCTAGNMIRPTFVL